MPTHHYTTPPICFLLPPFYLRAAPSLLLFHLWAVMPAADGLASQDAANARTAKHAYALLASPHHHSCFAISLLFCVPTALDEHNVR